MDTKKLDKIYASKKNYAIRPFQIIDILTYLGLTPESYNLIANGNELYVKLKEGHGTLTVTLRGVKSEE